MIFPELIAIRGMPLGIIEIAICFYQQNREDDHVGTCNWSEKSLSINILFYHAFPTVGILFKNHLSYFLLPSITIYHEKQTELFAQHRKEISPNINFTDLEFGWILIALCELNVVIFGDWNMPIFYDILCVDSIIFMRDGAWADAGLGIASRPQPARPSATRKIHSNQHIIQYIIYHKISAYSNSQKHHIQLTSRNNINKSQLRKILSI